jgi:hypothetical protein
MAHSGQPISAAVATEQKRIRRPPAHLIYHRPLCHIRIKHVNPPLILLKMILTFFGFDATVRYNTRNAWIALLLPQ